MVSYPARRGDTARPKREPWASVIWEQAVGGWIRIPGGSGKRSTEGRLIYAIGDVHGRLDLLEALVGKLLADAVESRPERQPMLILLGDYIDRGEDSAGVLSFIQRLQALDVFETRALKGNHEQAMLDFLHDATFGPTWVRYGGAQTLQSYGVAVPDPRGDPKAWEAARIALAAAAAEHMPLLETLELLIVVGDYAFVHAGVMPGTPLDQQVERDLLWIREAFMASDLAHEKIIVHGHTPVAQAQISPYRASIDTGAYATGLLTALRLDGDDQTLIQVQAGRGPAV